MLMLNGPCSMYTVPNMYFRPENRCYPFDAYFNPFPNDKFRLFQTERVCSHNFKFDENGRKFSRLVENTVGKGEIARNEQFLLFPQCFQDLN